MVCAAPKRLLHTARAAEPRHIVAGVRSHRSREERRFYRKRFVGRAWFLLAASARARRCVQRTERNRGLDFQTKVKDRFLNQRSEHVGILEEKKHASPSVTTSLVLLVFLF